MTFEQILILSLLQGLTEFLPISSSAHLILVPKFVDWPDQGLAFDVSVHVGTLAAVMLYFRSDITAMIKATWRVITRRAFDDDGRLAAFVVIATLPICLVGPFVKDFVESDGRSFAVIAATTLGFGVLLGIADWCRREKRTERTMRWWDALGCGVAQAIAPIPGTSRSGITVTAGLFLGMTREAAARFSFLMSVPTILLVGGFETLELIESSTGPNWTTLITGALISGISAYLCIHFFLKLINRIGLLPFVGYRLILGFVLVALCFTGAEEEADAKSNVVDTTPSTVQSLNRSGVSSTE